VVNHFCRWADVPWVKLSGRHPALRAGLDPVVADRGGRVQRVVDVRLGDRLEQRPAVGAGGRRRVLRPDAGVAVGLQLQPHRSALRTGPAADPVGGAEQVLDVVAVLVRDHVPLCERATWAPNRVRSSSKKPRSK
jgi:hypothetical protein